ncbi:MAG: hypothetical protein DMF88_06745, partial [Acidobacteria bacterium]
WDAAEDAFRRAMKRQPSYWLAHDHYAFVLAAQRQFDAALAEVRRGQALEPLSLVVHHHVAWVCLLARRYDDAIAECRSAIDMDPTFPMAHLWMGVSLEQKGLYDEAIASVDEAVKFMGGASIGAGAAAHAYAVSGQVEEARRRLAELQQARFARYVEPYGIALVCAGLGDREDALRWLEQAYQEHSFWLAFWAKVDPRLDVLRDDIRFQDLLRRLGLLQQARFARYVEPYGIALVCAGLGDREDALRWLEQAYQEHSFWLAFWAKVDPRLDVLRDDIRFQDLLRRLGLGSN